MVRADIRATWEALRAGLTLVRRAAREVPAPLAVSAAGWTAVFAAGGAGPPPDAAAALAWTGLGLVLLMTPPKLGALHRLAAGGEAREAPGAAGLQWTALEVRLTATAVALLGGGAALLAGPGVVVAAALPAFDELRSVAEGPRIAVLALLLGATAAACGWTASTIGRFCVTLAAEAAEHDPRFARGWLLTRGAGAAPAAVWLLTCALPLAGVLAALGAGDALAAARWPAPAVVAAGAVLALATQFLSAPLNAGALAQLRRAGLARAADLAADATVDTPGALGDKAPAPTPAAPQPELLAT